MQKRTAWLITPHTTRDGAGVQHPTPAINGLGDLLDRIARATAGDPGTILLSATMAKTLALDLDTIGAGDTTAAESAAAYGWKTTKPGTWTDCYGEGKPNLYVGRMADIAEAYEADERAWPWAGDPTVGMQAMQAWHDITGHPWRNFPAVVGVELIHATMGYWRIQGQKGNQKWVKADAGSPPGATEPVWSRDMWGRKPTGRYVHRYDRRRAAQTAAAMAKCAATGLQRRGVRAYDPTRAGWWLISTPPWQHKHLPHPCGPGAKTHARRWVTSPTMDLLREIADRGEIDFPEIIDSLTGPARYPLKGFHALCERAWQATLTDVPPALRPMLQNALKLSRNGGLGMLANPDSSCPRRDWYAAGMAARRCNQWRLMYRIGVEENRYPTGIDDDCIDYDSDDPNPVTAAPKTINPTTGKPWINLEDDIAGAFRVIAPDRRCPNHPDDQICPECTQ